MSGQAITAEMRAVGAPRLPQRAAAKPWAPLALAGACVLAMAAVWAVAELVPSAHAKDAVALYHFTTLSRPTTDSIGEFLLSLLSVKLFVLWAIALIAVAIAEERPYLAAAVALVLVLAPFSADVLKPLLAHQHDKAAAGVSRIGAASWPSGHATAATVLALSATLVSPRRLRPWVGALGLVFVLAVSVSLLVLAWHMPSDVIGGILLATMWVALAVAVLRTFEPAGGTRGAARQPSSPAG